MPPDRRDRNYDSIHRLYAWLSNDSPKRLPPWKAVQLDQLQPGQRVLYVGVGPAFDAMAAAAHGCEVTCIDLAGDMLGRAEQRFARAGLHATFIKGDVLTHEPAEPYDAIVANFFFNMFTPDHARQFLHRFSHVLHPQGRLFISDFKPTGFIATLNYRFALMFFASLGLARWQPMNDCVALLSETGWSVESVRDFGRRYRAITAMPTPP